jgi:predicted nicotinamide N-methyase
LASVTAALAGASVLAVDRSPEATAYAAVNAARNGVTLNTAVCAFDQPERLLREAPWDLVLAADVLYEQRNVPVLVWLLPRLVDATGEVWLADPGRPMLSRFLAAVDAAGWRRDQVETIHRLRRPVPDHRGQVTARR